MKVVKWVSASLLVATGAAGMAQAGTTKVVDDEKSAKQNSVEMVKAMAESKGKKSIK